MRRVTCRNVEPLLFDYADGAVGEPERSAIAVHLAICDSCRASAALCSGVRVAVREAPLAPAPRLRSAPPIEVDRFAAARRRLRVGAIAAAVAAACIGALGLGLGLGAAGRGLDTAAPAVAWRHAVTSGTPGDGDAAPIAPSVDRAGHVAFEVAPGTALRCDGPAQVEAASSNPQGARFAVRSGRVLAEVGAVEYGFHFVVATPEAEIEARGTVFSVEVSSSGATTAVRVSAGSVEVRELRTGASLVVSAGEEIRVGDPAPHTAALDEVTRDLAVALELSTEALRPTGVAGAQRASQQEDLPDATPAEIVAAADALVAAIADARDQMASPRAGSSAARLLELAQAYRRASLFDDAARTYERLVSEHRTSDIGLSGLVALAQLESLVLGKVDAARSHFAAYLEAAPRGPLASVAREGLAKTDPE